MQSNSGLQYLECEVGHVLQEFAGRLERVWLVVVAVGGSLQIHRIVVDVVRILQVIGGQLFPDEGMSRRKWRLMGNLGVNRCQWLRLLLLLHLLNGLVLWMNRRGGQAAIRRSTTASSTSTATATASAATATDSLSGRSAYGRTGIIRTAGNVRERVGVVGADRQLAVDGDVATGAALPDRLLRAGRLEVLAFVPVLVPVGGCNENGDVGA